jgi:hypothetical protein
MRDDSVWRTFPLTPAQIALKSEALSLHRTQYNYDRAYLSSFLRANELFASFPVPALPPLSTSLGPAFTTSLVTEREPAALGGIASKTVGLEGENVVFTTRFSHPVGDETLLNLFAYGYRKDKPFQEMPKIHIHFGPIRHGVFVGKKRLPWTTVRVRRSARELTVWVPLSVLGRPEEIFTSVRSALVFPLDWATWRVFHVPELSGNLPVK